jgi:hypothetical protein
VAHTLAPKAGRQATQVTLVFGCAVPICCRQAHLSKTKLGLSRNRAGATLSIQAPSLFPTPQSEQLDPLDRIIMDIIAALLSPRTKR